MNGENLTELSLWDRFKIAITPKSSAEALVDSMYSPETRGMPGLPGFPTNEEISEVIASPETPQFVVETQRAIVAPFKQAAVAISGTTKKYAIIGFIGVALLIVLYAGTSAFIRR